MTRPVRILVALAVLAAAGVSPALAWQCPTQWRAAEEAIKNAEAMNIPPEAKAMLEDAKRFVAESKNTTAKAPPRSSTRARCGRPRPRSPSPTPSSRSRNPS